jgi:hypothetical protein
MAARGQRQLQARSSGCAKITGAMAAEHRERVELGFIARRAGCERGALEILVVIAQLEQSPS